MIWELLCRIKDNYDWSKVSGIQFRLRRHLADTAKRKKDKEEKKKHMCDLPEKGGEILPYVMQNAKVGTIKLINDVVHSFFFS